MDKILNSLSENRHVTSDYHARLGRYWRMYGEPKLLHAPLSYSAFEYRLAMERCIFELYFVMKERKISDKELKYDFGKIVKATYKCFGGGKTGKKRLTRWMHFNSIYQKNLGKLMNYPQDKIAVVDVDRVTKFWTSLSKYCHRQLSPEITWKDNQWIKEGYNKLNEVEDYIWEVMVKSSLGWLEPRSLPPEIRNIANDFIEEKIDQVSLEARLSIIIPVLIQKDRNFIKIISITK